MSKEIVQANFILEALLGTGSAGEVWRVRMKDGRKAALKRLLPHLTRHEPSVLAFERESRLYGRFQHPSIPRYIAQGRDERGPFLLLEYVEGTTLEALIGTPVPCSLALRVARDLLAALQTIHDLEEGGRRLGLVHRDLSPANVLVGNAGTVKLADFGIARSLMGSHATTGVMAKGTLGYMSPEQARGDRVDARSDLFAVGALLHEMLSGSPPYDEGEPRLALARARAGDVIPFEQVMPGVDPDLASFMDQALAAEPVERFVSADHMRKEIERIGSRLGIASDQELGAWARTRPRHEQPAERVLITDLPGKKRSGRLAWTLLVGALMALLLVVGWVALRSPEDPSVQASVAVSALLTAPAPSSELDASIRSVAASSPVPSQSTPAETSIPSAPSTRPKQQPAVLDIGSTPSYAYVTINGRPMGPTPLFGLKLSPGRHTVRVEREGLGSRTITIDLLPGQRTTKVVSLP